MNKRTYVLALLLTLQIIISLITLNYTTQYKNSSETILARYNGISKYITTNAEYMDKLVRENERLRQQVADYREQMKVFSFVKEGKE